MTLLTEQGTGSCQAAFVGCMNESHQAGTSDQPSWPAQDREGLPGWQGFRCSTNALVKPEKLLFALEDYSMAGLGFSLYGPC